MKLTMRIIMILCVILISKTKACAQEYKGNNTVELIVGAWKLNYDKTINSVKPQSREFYNKLSQQRRNQIEVSYRQRKIFFLEEGRFVMELKDSEKKYGEWSLKENQKKLQVKMDNGGEFNLEIEEIGSDVLLLNLRGDKTAKRLLGKWYLDKIY